MDNGEIGTGIQRMILGLVFLIPGLGKLMTGAEGITGMLTNLGFPAAAFLAWLLVAVEVIGGLMLIAGWYHDWAAWPLLVAILVAGFAVYWPNSILDIPGPVAQATFLLHLGVAAALANTALSGPGAWALKKA